MIKHFKSVSIAIILFFIFSSFSLVAAGSNQQYRFFQFFVEEASIVPTQWWEGQFRFISDGQYRSINIPDSDTLAFSPIIAIAPWDNIEIGIIFSIEDIDYDIAPWRDIGGSGLSDTDIYGKYKLKTEPFEFTLGALATLPSGDEDEGRGTGKVNVELFGSSKKDYGDFIITGIFGLRLNRDAEILARDILPGLRMGVRLDAKTSVLLGGGIIFPFSDNLAFSGELSVESERYDQIDSDIRLTPGIQFKTFENSLLRAGLGIGLSDGAPDFEVILSYVYTF